MGSQGSFKAPKDLGCCHYCSLKLEHLLARVSKHFKLCTQTGACAGRGGSRVDSGADGRPDFGDLAKGARRQLLLPARNPLASDPLAGWGPSVLTRCFKALPPHPTAALTVLPPLSPGQQHLPPLKKNETKKQDTKYHPGLEKGHPSWAARPVLAPWEPAGDGGEGRGRVGTQAPMRLGDAGAEQRALGSLQGLVSALARITSRGSLDAIPGRQELRLWEH